MTANFQVVVPGSHKGSMEDWYRAQNAPVNDLPPLTAEQKEMAAKFGVSEEEYQRGVLVGRYGDLRQHQRGQALGNRVADILQGLGSAYYFVMSVELDDERDRWVVEVMNGNAGRKRIAIPLTLADALIDSGTVQDLAQFEKLVLDSIGRTVRE